MRINAAGSLGVVVRGAPAVLLGAVLTTAVACSGDEAGEPSPDAGGGSAGAAGAMGGGAGGGAGSGAGGVSGHAGNDASTGGVAGSSCDGSVCVVPCLVTDCSSGPCVTSYDVDSCDYAVVSGQERRIGVYSWGFAPAPAQGAERLSWGADRVAEVGSRAIRVYLGPADSYGVNPPGTFTLLAAAQSPAYAKLFGDPRFDVIWITAYSVADNATTFMDGYDTAEDAAERAEIAALGQHLLLSYPGKTFVIANWEGDNQLSGQTSDLAWQGFTDWTASRAAGVADAVLAAQGSSSHLYAALEFNRVEGCGAQRCVVSHVAPKVAVGFYSYSSYESINQQDAAGA